MDEFGVLVESIGFKAHGKSVPMSHLKSNPKSNTNYGFNTALPQDRAVSSSEDPSNSLISKDSFVDDLDGIFLSKTNISSTTGNFDDSNDIFGGSKPPLASHSQGSLDLDSVFEFNRSISNHTSNFYDDLFTSTPQNTDAIHDLLGNFGAKSQSFKSDSEGNGSQFDDLIPGFGGISTPSIGSSNSGIRKETKHSQPSSGQSFNSSSGFVDDPFLVFESSNSTNASSSVQCSIDDLEKFAMGKVNDDASDNKHRSPTHTKIKLSLRNRDERAPNKASVPKIKTQHEVLHQKQKQKVNGRTESLIKEKGVFVNGNDLDDIFGMGTEPSHVSNSRTEDPFFDTLFNGGGRSKMKQASPKTPYNTERPSGTSFSDNFSSLFGEAAASSEAFQEIEGESEERRRARLNHHMRTQARMAKALAEKNQRDLETQYEQEHRRKLATTLDGDIKRWATGKEGNLRALLSSLQDVLWPECGWRPVSLTDLITSVSVKKVYQKATLCVHPDKVQQKGADLQQKYIAEKVFDLLKEAWNKFTAEELR